MIRKTLIVIPVYVRGEGVARKMEDRGGTKGKNSRSSSPGAIILRRDPGDSQCWIVVRPLSSCVKSKGCMLDDGH